MKRYIIILLTILFLTQLSAQEKNGINAEITVLNVDAITDAELDTIDVRKKLIINDYSMIGIQYGAGLSQVSWNPSQKQDMVFVPYNVGITYTHYGKMFGYMPYFGLQVGLFYGQEGYQFKYNEDKDYTYTIAGAEKALMEVVEAPIMFQFHYDMWNFKILAQIGCFAGYRLSIERFPGKTGNVKDEVRHSFLETDRRMDYGIKGGVGFALVFEPVELHFQAMYKHSLASLYEPDHASKYFYRFAYPSNIVLSVGTHFHLTKRSGKTKSEIKKMARDMVFNTDSNGNTQR